MKEVGTAAVAETVTIVLPLASRLNTTEGAGGVPRPGTVEKLALNALVAIACRPLVLLTLRIAVSAAASTAFERVVFTT